MQINRFCASGLDAVNLAAAQVMAGMKDIAIGGGVESMSRVGMGASGGAWPVDPGIAIANYSCRRGYRRISSRPNTVCRGRCGRLRGGVRRSAPRGPGMRAVSTSPSIPVRDINGLTILAKDEHMRPSTDMQSLGQLKAAFVQMGEMGGFDAVAIAAHPE